MKQQIKAQFFGRHVGFHDGSIGGGKSSGIFASLNCGYASGDAIENITENRRIICAEIGVSPDNLCVCSQVHGRNVVELTKPWHWQNSPEADAMVSRTTGIALGILTADCAPVLFADSINGVIGAAHAGWRGAVAGVVEHTVQAMVKIGASLDNIQAQIGPCAGVNSYEVDNPMRDQVIAEQPEDAEFFSVNPTNSDKYFFNLEAYVASRVNRAGVADVKLSGIDTISNELEYFSFRRSTLRGEKQYGRQISVIALV